MMFLLALGSVWPLWLALALLLILDREVTA